NDIEKYIEYNYNNNKLEADIDLDYTNFYKYYLLNDLDNMFMNNVPVKPNKKYKNELKNAVDYIYHMPEVKLSINFDNFTQDVNDDNKLKINITGVNSDINNKLKNE